MILATRSRRVRHVLFAVATMAALSVSTPAREAGAAIPASERQALIDLYNATNGGSWTHSTGWNGAGGTECNWYGVTCDGTGTTVQSLNLGYNNLVGTVPTTLGNLTGLTLLDLYDNKLSGSISYLSNLTKMQQAYLSINQLTGSIPDLSGLTSLQRLDLSYNQLTGSIPLELGNLTSLGYLWLGSNHLTGSIPDLSKLTSLYLLDLSSNQLVGSIPTWMGSLTSLHNLYLSGNQLTGAIPVQLANLTNLQWIYLGSNQLTGSIPDLSGLTSLQRLDLSYNQLTGSIPDLSSLTSLFYLYLNNNQLSGAIPKTFCSNTKLVFFALNSNQLVGAVPSCITSLTSLYHGDSDLRWNGLYSSDAGVVTFLNNAQSGGDWQSTQTVPVTNLAPGSPTQTSIALTWTSITYTGDTGGYEVFEATASGGPFTLFGTTADKTATGMPVTGLTAGTPYWFYVQSVTTPNPHNQNTVTSDPTGHVTLSTLAPLLITTTAPLPAGAVNIAYNQTFTATGGTGGNTWSVISGSLPPGLNPLSSAGVLSGTPTTVGNYSFTVQVKDADGTTTSDPFTLQINAEAGGIPLFGPLGLLCLIAALGAVGALAVRRLTS